MPCRRPRVPFLRRRHRTAHNCAMRCVEPTKRGGMFWFCFAHALSSIIIISQTRAAQSSPEQARAGQSSPKQTRADQSSPEQPRAGQSRPKQPPNASLHSSCIRSIHHHHASIIIITGHFGDLGGNRPRPAQHRSRSTSRKTAERSKQRQNHMPLKPKMQSF